MAEKAADRAEAVLKVQQATTDAPAEVQTAAMQALIGQPGAAATDYAWRVLVTALALALLGALGALIYVVVEKPNVSATPIIAAFTSLLSGLLGLYIKSPGQQT